MATKMLSVTILSLMLTLYCVSAAPPTFTSDFSNFTVSEDLPVGSSVFELKAVDLIDNTVVTYDIVADMFSVNEVTGVVTLTRLVDFDVGEKRLPIRVIAIDGNGLRSEVDITVLVFDANDNPARFTRTSYKVDIPENTPRGTIIFDNLEVRDRDYTRNNGIQVTCDDTRVDALYRDSCTIFKVNRRTYSTRTWNGYITLEGTLDFESRPTLQLSLKTFDGDNEYVQSFEVIIEDVNDAPPYFIKQVQATVNESIPVNTTVNDVKAIDGDKTLQRKIRYTYITGNGCNEGGFFHVDYETGDIINIKKLDREQVELSRGFVVLCITAHELINATTVPEIIGQDPQTTAKANVTINVQDDNDNAPSFDKKFYYAKIPENIPNGSGLELIMTVSDNDQGTASMYDFRLLNHTDIFEIFPGNGQGQTATSIKVINTDKIDYDVGPRFYELTVHAVETQTVNRRTGTCIVQIEILDVNDNSPIFNPPDYSEKIPENAQGGRVVVTVTATDEDGKNSSKPNDIYFRLVGNGADKFNIGLTSGEVTVADCSTPGEGNCIDFEKRQKYQLTVMATDERGKGRQNTGQLTVDILDVNDNPPVFDRNTYLSNINEGETTTIDDLVIVTNDVDTVGGPTTYSIEGDKTGIWQIDSLTGRITARQPVKYEDSDNGEFVFDVKAVNTNPRDSFPTLVRVTIMVIDRNNWPPVFKPEEYTETIDEDIPPMSFVITVTATDEDSSASKYGKIEYSIEQGHKGKFQIDRNNGTITTTSTATFDFDRQKIYRLIVVGRDGGNPQKSGQAVVNVYIRDKNNRLPFFQPTTQRFSISENTTAFTNVYTVRADDPDQNNTLRYRFEGPKSAITPDGIQVNPTVYDYTSLFSIQAETGIISTTSNNLDRDQASIITYQMIVEDIGQAGARQLGTGTVIITILEYNDEPPVFEQANYNITIDEELPIGTFVMTLIARDKADVISAYTLTSNPQQFFSIADKTGVVSIRRQMDYEKIQYTQFTVEATDDGRPTRTGTTTVYVTIRNINDNSPTFLQDTYSVRIPEQMGPSGVLMTVQAEDIDAGDYGIVRYRLDSNERRFSIDPISGEIRLLAGVELDREDESTITIQVTAYDSPNTPRVRRENPTPVYFELEDVNDNEPVFSAKEYYEEIIETTPVGSTILPLIATDRDIGNNAALSFTKTESSLDPKDLFDIGPSSGKVYVKRNLLGLAGTYIFEVTVQDLNGQTGALSAKALVTIKVLEATNSPPTWILPPNENMTISVLESQYLGMLVYDSHAEDKDKGNSGIVDYGFLYGGVFTNATPEFHINKVTGVIRAEIVYDREQVDTYLLQLIARDRGDPPLQSTRFLTVKILDVNDNLPTFPMSNGVVLPYKFEIPEGVTTRGTPIGTVTATDLDLPQYSKIYYTIVAGNEKDWFNLDRNTGNLTLNKPIDRDTLENDVISLYIHATNNVSDYSVRRNRRQVDPSYVEAQITVQDVNDEVPQFIYPTGTNEYHGCISLNAPFGQSIIQIQADDKDSSGPAGLMYYLQADDDITRQMFSINRRSGMISNRNFLNNYPDRRIYKLTVVVSDGKNNATTPVQIFVTSESNEEKLVINQKPSEVRLMTPQLVRTLSGVDDLKYICVMRVSEHVLSDGKLSDSQTDVYVAGISPDTGTNSYRILPADDLNAKLQTAQSGSQKDEFDALYIDNLGGPSSARLFVDSTPVLVVLIIVILLIILALILFFLACYCIRDSKRKKIKKYNEGQIVTVVEQPVEAGKTVNPMYDNRGFVPDSREPKPVPHAEIVDEEPAIVRSPPEEEYTMIKKPLDTDEPVIETTIEPDEPEPKRISPEPPVIPEIDEPEPVIETEIIDDHPPVNHSPPPPIQEEEIETEIIDDSPEPRRRVTPPIEEKEEARTTL